MDLEEDNEAFLAKLKDYRGEHDEPTYYSTLTDEEMLARYGKEVQIIGRPPGM